MYSKRERDHVKVEGIHTERQQHYYSNNNNNYNRFRDNNRFDRDKQFSIKHQIPFLVKAFWRINGEILVDEFQEDRIADLNQNELCLYLLQFYQYINNTYSLGSTLRDIVDQLKYQIDGVYRRDTRFKIHNIYLHSNGLHRKKELGFVHSVKTGKDDDKQIKDCGFKVGDFLVVEISGKLNQ